MDESPVKRGADDGNRTRVFSLGSLLRDSLANAFAQVRRPTGPALTSPDRAASARSVPRRRWWRKVDIGGTAGVSTNARAKSISPRVLKVVFLIAASVSAAVGNVRENCWILVGVGCCLTRLNC